MISEFLRKGEILEVLIEFLKEPVLVDGSEYLKDLRINITKDKQMRLKAKYLNTGKEIPIDLVVYRFTLPNFSKPPIISISLDGRNMTVSGNFTMMVSYNYISGKWKLKYDSITKSIRKEGHNLLKEITEIIHDVLSIPTLPMKII